MNIRKQRRKAWKRWQSAVARRKNGISCPEGSLKQKSLTGQRWNMSPTTEMAASHMMRTREVVDDTMKRRIVEVGG